MKQDDGVLLRETAREYVRLQRSHALCCGTTSTQCHILCAIGAQGSIEQSELGSRLGLEKSWISRALDSLEREGLIERRRSDNDSRIKSVSLSASGTARYEALDASLNAHARSILDRIPETERGCVRKALELLAQAVSGAEREE